VVRAVAHDEMEEADRVRTNERVRDHFSALPPEDLDRVTSVEDPQRTITLFRALAGAGSLGAAARAYRSRLSLPLYVQLGVITLGEQLAPADPGDSGPG
jgi:hypothetical protein